MLNNHIILLLAGWHVMIRYLDVPTLSKMTQFHNMNEIGWMTPMCQKTKQRHLRKGSLF